MAVTSATSTSGVSTDLLQSMNGTTATTDDSSVEAQTDKFLTLLVAQLQNQDPMNPTDNAQLTSQLAQLSTVTGVNKLNTTLESLQTSYQSSQALEAANMIGHGVLTAGTALTLSDSQAIYGVDLATAADNVTINILDSTGKLVHSIDMGAQVAGTVPMAWDGTVDDLNGTGVAGTVADGTYKVQVVATRSGETLTDATALQFGTVASVSTNSTGVTLNIPTLGKVTMADVKQVL
jgi:flagellar basal-body rod modification protein FlgD